jgi:crotonobetainyl-CoA:carnitine CoA-transferase CaiB-like acyl-CoA transferase
MERWGLTYDALREIVPDIIFARMSGFGHAGPYRAYRSYGPVIQAACGLTHVAGLPDREPSGWGFSYMDNMASYFNSAAVLLAVLHREQTGEGSEVSCAAVDIGVNLLGQFFLDASVNDRPTRRPGFPTGNRLEHPAVAPHGVYRCAGDDRWVAITVFDDEEWRKLVRAMDSPAWADDDCFATIPARVAHQDELDHHLTAWTSTRDPHEVMGILQRCGVRAGAVQDGQDLNERDPHLAHRGTFFELDHPVIGPARFEGFPTQFSRSRPDHWRSAPLLGEDNDYVLGEILGVAEDERRELEAAGVI